MDCDKQWSQLHFLSRPLGRSQRNEFIHYLSLWLQLRVVIQVLLYKLPEGCTFTLGYPSRLMCRSLQPLLALETARPCGWQFLWPHEGNAIWRCSMSQLHGLRQLHTSTPMTFSSLKPTSEGQYWCYLAFLGLQASTSFQLFLSKSRSLTPDPYNSHAWPIDEVLQRCVFEDTF